jgi:hypothetical protein
VKVVVVVADGRDDLPDVLACADEASTATGGPIDETNERVLVHTQPLFDIALGEGARRHVRALCL